MAITLAQMHDYVWGYFELDSDDLPTSLLNRWADEGFTRVHRHVKRWPHYESTETVNTADGVAEYAPTLSDVHSISGPDGLLRWMEHTEAQRLDDRAVLTGGDPRVWSQWAGTLFLWPTPSSVETLTVSGYRDPTPFTAGGVGAIPDLPDDFHQLVLGWVMHRCYQHQDDFEGAQLELSEFASMLDILTRHETQAPVSAPLVMGGTRRSRGGVPSRQKYPWE